MANNFYRVEKVHESPNTNKVVINLVYDDDGVGSVTNGLFDNTEGPIKAATTASANQLQAIDFAVARNEVLNVEDFKPSSMGAVVAGFRIACIKGVSSSHDWEDTNFSLVDSFNNEYIIFPPEGDIDVKFPFPFRNSNVEVDQNDVPANGNLYFRPVVKVAPARGGGTASGDVNQSLNVQLVFEKIYEVD